MAPSTNGKLTDDVRTLLSGKMNMQVAAMVASGEVGSEAAGEFLLERATKKATKNGLIESATA